MDLRDVEQRLKGLGEPPFRLKQIKRAFYIELRGGWEDVTTISKSARESLKTGVPWDAITPDVVRESAKHDTIKVLFSCADAKKIEAVLMRHEGDRNTVCVSSQIGCPMKCAFCATGKMGFTRNLTAEEIVSQVIFFARRLKAENQRITNVVYMGMGEPMHNYDEVMRSVRLLNDPDGFGLGARHISISTCGIVPGILRLADEPLQVNLAISLHSAIDEKRSEIMPANIAYPLKKLMEAVDAYSEKTNRKVLFEYLLLDGINDQPKDAEAIAALLRHRFRLYQVNLIKYHDTDVFTSTPEKKREAFMHQLEDLGVPVTHRVSFGEDIEAACGQLAGKQNES
jgi:23S rRNA (adenine2503-C2)-methyltransferase